MLRESRRERTAVASALAGKSYICPRDQLCNPGSLLFFAVVFESLLYLVVTPLRSPPPTNPPPPTSRTHSLTFLGLATFQWPTRSEASQRRLVRGAPRQPLSRFSSSRKTQWQVRHWPKIQGPLMLETSSRLQHADQGLKPHILTVIRSSDKDVSFTVEGVDSLSRPILKANAPWLFRELCWSLLCKTIDEWHAIRRLFCNAKCMS